MRAVRRKRQTGTVVSDRMDKSIVVSVRWTSRHRVYKKAQYRLAKFLAHDEENRATVGDIVRIEETRPLSRRKRWRLVEIVQAVEVADVQPTDVDPEAGAAVGTEEPE